MKRLLVFILFISLVLSYTAISYEYLHDIFENDIERIYIYSNCKNNLENIRSMPNGCGEILCVDTNDVGCIIDKLSSMAGECLLVSNEYSIEDIVGVLSLNILEKVEINDGVLITGYTNKLPNSIFSNGTKINIQIYKSELKMLIGYPLILQGFWNLYV